MYYYPSPARDEDADGEDGEDDAACDARRNDDHGGRGGGRHSEHGARRLGGGGLGARHGLRVRHACNKGYQEMELDTRHTVNQFDKVDPDHKSKNTKFWAHSNT